MEAFLVCVGFGAGVIVAGGALWITGALLINLYERWLDR